MDSVDVATISDATSFALGRAIEAFTGDPMRAATARALADEIGLPESTVAGALDVLRGFGILEAVASGDGGRPTYRFRVASTFLDVLDRVAVAYADRLDAVPGASEHLQALRARVATLEAKNTLLASRADECAFRCDAEALVGATLDRATIAQAVLDAVPVAACGRARRWCLLLCDDDGGIVCHDGVGIDRREASSFVERHRATIDRCLRTGELDVGPQSRAIIPMSTGQADFAAGAIAVLEAGDGGLTAVELRRLTELAEIARRAFANAWLLASSILAGVTDQLTGVYNRRYLDRRLADELKRVRRLGERMSLVLVDLDRFKRINDEHGHAEGDGALRAVAQAILGAVRDIDVVTRWGGEEFAIVLPGTDGAAAVAVAERVRRAIERMPFETQAGTALRITISCGVAWAAPHIHTPAQCVAAADRCLLEAKRAGRNRTVAMDGR